MGTVSLMSEDNRESFNIREGDFFWISAGTPTYLINRQNNQNLVIAKLLQPVAVPGRFEVDRTISSNLFMHILPIEQLIL